MQRRQAAFQVRLDTALAQRAVWPEPHVANGDELRYREMRLACFAKGLPHDELGMVDPSAYDALVRALEAGSAEDLEEVPMGGTLRLTNPLAAHAFVLEGADSHDLTCPPAPAFASQEAAGEMVEVYWQALTRDVPFADYATDPLIAAAVADLQRFPQFTGVDAATLFRGETAGDLTGPYLSQFLWLPVPYGPLKVEQLYPVPKPGVDFLTGYKEWLDVQRGVLPSVGTERGEPGYLATGRDLSEWVHRDFSYQGFLNAALILLGFGAGALDDGNPYLGLSHQGGFVTFGGPDVLTTLALAAHCALKAAWCQKWLVHRRLRPEVFAGRVHNHRLEVDSYPIHKDLLDSPALDAVYGLHGTYLLPQAYPEGSPAHPAYPAGHAAIAGACATVLKAFFQEDFKISAPVEASADGATLLVYTASSLTVGGELDKLASNLAIGRDTAGVHYRSDGIEGLRLGEKVALALLRDLRETYAEPFPGFTLTRFDGTLVTV
jgi:membrane-associated phospholipid phosphatase